MDNFDKGVEAFNAKKYNEAKKYFQMCIEDGYKETESNDYMKKISEQSKGMETEKETMPKPDEEDEEKSENQIGGFGIIIKVVPIEKIDNKYMEKRKQFAKNKGGMPPWESTTTSD